MRRLLVLTAVVMFVTLVGAPSANAFHFFRGNGSGGTGSGCSPTDGPTTDDASTFGSSAATIRVLHNTFNDAATGLPETTINAGQSVTWVWNSSHCHSVQGPAFYSGFHYPTAVPESPKVVPGFFEYPVPDLTPTLSFTHTFTAPGVYKYQCEHHALIGMVGVINVQ